MSTRDGWPWQHVVRDLALVVATILLWRLDAEWRAGGGVAALLVGVVTGILTALCSYLFHEWGHLIAARLGGSFVRLPDSLFEPFLFNFDSDRNTPRQFAVMSCGGFAASLLVLVFLVWVLPWPALSGLIALGLAVAGVIATAVLEVPPFWRVLHGAPIPTGAAYVSGARQR